MVAPNRYWVGLDVGQANDPTAMSVTERVVIEPLAPTGEEIEAARRAFMLDMDPPSLPQPTHEYHVRYLDRPPLRTSYNSIVEGVVKRLVELEPADTISGRRIVGLIVDATGVGRAIKDMLRKEINALDPYTSPRVRVAAVNVTGGNKVNFSDGFYNIPKRDLISAGVIGLQEKKLLIGEDVENRDVLIKELLDYRLRINVSTAHDSYEPWREGEHDDLLFATCLATWAWRQTDSRPKLRPMAKPRGWG